MDLIRRQCERATALIFFTICLSMAQPSLATAPSHLMINQHLYQVDLHENTDLLHQLRREHNSSHSARHYSGLLNGDPHSWVRVSNIAGRWQGVAYFGGSHYIVDTDADGIDHSKTIAGEPGVMAAATIEESVSDFGPLACSASTMTKSFSPIRRSAQPGGMPPALAIVQPAAFSSLCSSTINGTCLIAGLEIAFDQDFAEEFDSIADASANVEAIINILEGYYQEDFNIAFERVTIHYLGNNFSNTSESTDLLGELRIARLNNEFSFLQSEDTLFHLLTGRDLDGNTAGVAYVGGLCNSFALGLTSAIRDFIGNFSLPVTAIVVAHELGHNFGAEHDIDPNATCGGGFIMEATVSASNTSFSSCSIADILANIESITRPEQCFDFAVDLSITANPENPTTVNDTSDFTTEFDVATASIFEAIGSISVSGSIDNSQGAFVSATLNGASCMTNNQGLEYRCELSNPPASSTLLVTATASNGPINFIHRAEVTGSEDVQDVDLANNQVQNTIAVTVSMPPANPSNLVARQGDGLSVNLSWEDNSSNESEFVLLRRDSGTSFSELTRVTSNTTNFTDTTTQANTTYEYQILATNEAGNSDATTSAPITVNSISNNSGGGGGGAFGFASMVCLLVLSLFRRRISRGI